MKEKVVLAYSGGLDTTAIIPWLKETYGYEVVCCCINCGQGEELDGLEERAKLSGASKLYIEDITDEFCDDYIVPCVQAGAVYEHKYLLGTAMARPGIAKKLVEIARKENAVAICHGATGKGNDQIRFELGIKALAPDIKIIAPWRDDKWQMDSREAEIAYCKAHGIDLPFGTDQSYSRDRNLWHISHEGLELENPANEPNYDHLLVLGVSPEKAPDEGEYVTMTFEKGVPKTVNGKEMKVSDIIRELNRLGGKHGVGIIDIVENRVVGMKSRGVYETPGGTILMEAHDQLEELVLDRDTLSAKKEMGNRLANVVYEGKWFTPLREAIQAFVKARVKAHALHEIIESRENVIIMGHSLTDVDSLGAGIGIFCAARVLGKKAQIVINEPTTSIRPLMECFTPEKGYPEDMFINSEIAIEEVSRNSLVMVVDTNRPSYTECPELLTRTDTIVVFDHHRQGSEVIENPLLSYIEPYASSACEMVAEVLQYFQEGFKLSPAEADCIYAGILIDTNNFMTKTGVRTFEAAAYLRRSGAEVTRVRKMLRNDMACYKARAEAVRHAEVYRGAFAISVCPSEDVESPTIVGAQAANELLNIIGIKASFVLTEYAGKIYISSRSIDEINVQLIMERMGGGGHLNVAGAQLTGCTISEAKHAIMRTIDEMLEEGDIQE